MVIWTWVLVLLIRGDDTSIPIPAEKLQWRICGMSCRSVIRIVRQAIPYNPAIPQRVVGYCLPHCWINVKRSPHSRNYIFKFLLKPSSALNQFFLSSSSFQQFHQSFFQSASFSGFLPNFSIYGFPFLRGWPFQFNRGCSILLKKGLSPNFSLWSQEKRVASKPNSKRLTN